MRTCHNNFEKIEQVRIEIICFLLMMSFCTMYIIARIAHVPDILLFSFISSHCYYPCCVQAEIFRPTKILTNVNCRHSNSNIYILLQLYLCIGQRQVVFQDFQRFCSFHKTN